MLRWWRKRKRARILAEPFPDEWLEAIERDVALWRAVPEASRPRLLDDARLFIAERYWEPCGGIELTPSMCAVIAVQACVLTLGRSVDAFDHVRSILVYPTAYRAPDVWEDESGIVTEELDDRDGEAWEWGSVVLSWQQVLADSRTLHGRNLVLHELAHQLDLLDTIDRPTLIGAGRHDGLAPLANSEFLVGHMPNAHLEIFDGGHLMMFQAPRVWPTVIDFLSR